MMKTITLKRLKELGACADELLKFEQLFGAEVAVTEEICIKHYQDFNFDWAADNLLRYIAWDEYERVCGPALAEYRRASDTALAEYKRVCGPAWDEYRRVSAITFCRLFNGGE